jgi:hypothetical protein
MIAHPNPCRPEVRLLEGITHQHADEGHKGHDHGSEHSDVRVRDDLVCITSASAAVEMTAKYCENRMTADWTYSPIVIDVSLPLLPSSHSAVGPNKSQALIGHPFVRRMPDRVLSRDDAIDDIGGGVMGFRILRGSDGIAMSRGSVLEKSDDLLLTHDFLITQGNE